MLHCGGRQRGLQADPSVPLRGSRCADGQKRHDVQSHGRIWRTTQLWRNGCLVSVAGSEGWLYVHQGGFHGGQHTLLLRKMAAAACADAMALCEGGLQPEDCFQKTTFF